ncbi:MAG: hypothetical protein N2491_09105 [Negativicutes bacterium]|nr:hypothetical protein [Negativicutes bacterium]
MTRGVKPEKPKLSLQAKKANAAEGYGPNNPEPPQYHAVAKTDRNSSANALQAAEEYLYGKKE